MVRSYWISASCCCALASSTLDRMRPAVKMGCVTCGTNCQIPAGPVKSPESCVLCVPSEPVRLMRGKYAAFATPINALDAISVCSAARISGRRSSNAEGKPVGTVGGCSGQGLSTGDGIRVAPEEKTDLVFCLRDRL